MTVAIKQGWQSYGFFGSVTGESPVPVC